jgi:hypothetical protein
MLNNEQTTGSRVHGERKKTVPQLVKKFLAFYGTRRLVAMFTRFIVDVSISLDP